MNKIQGHGIPTKFKAAERGTVYTDLDTGKRYKCLGPKGFVNQDAVEEPIEYHWQLVNMVEDNQIPNGGVELPFGEKTSRTNSLKSTEIDGFEQDDEWYKFWFDDPNYLELEEPVILGEKYTLVYDGVEYSATVQDEENSVFFGINYYWTGDRFDDLPFGVLLSAKYDSELDTRVGTKVQCVFTDSSAAKTHTLEIYKDNVEITPLPNKYLDIVETVDGDTLVWDGDITGKVTATGDDGNIYVKVSDIILSDHELNNGCGYVCISGDYRESYDVSDLESVVFTDDAIDIDCSSVMVIRRNDVTYEGDGWNVHFPEKGIYFYYTPDEYIIGFTINGYTGFPNEQIKQEYLFALYNKIDTANAALDTANAALDTASTAINKVNEMPRFFNASRYTTIKSTKSSQLSVGEETSITEDYDSGYIPILLRQMKIGDTMLIRYNHTDGGGTVWADHMFLTMNATGKAQGGAFVHHSASEIYYYEIILGSDRFNSYFTRML